MSADSVDGLALLGSDVRKVQEAIDALTVQLDALKASGCGSAERPPVAATTVSTSSKLEIAKN